MAVLMKEKIVKICDLIMEGLNHIGIDLNSDEKVINYIMDHRKIVVAFFSELDFVNAVVLSKSINMRQMDFTQASMLAILADHDKDFDKYPFSVPALMKNMINNVNAEKVIGSITNVTIQFAPLHIINARNPIEEIYREAKQALNNIGLDVEKLKDDPKLIYELCDFLKYFINHGCFRYDAKTTKSGHLYGVFCKGIFTFAYDEDEYKEDEFPLLKDFGFLSIASVKRLKRYDIDQIRLEFPIRISIDISNEKIELIRPTSLCYRKLGL